MIQVLPSLNPYLHVVLGEEISLHEFVNVVEPVGNGSKILLHVGPFNTTVRIKDIHGEALPHPMNDIKTVRPDGTRGINEKGENSHTTRISHYRDSVYLIFTSRILLYSCRKNMNLMPSPREFMSKPGKIPLSSPRW
jgi:hypothetical protein